MLCLCDDNDKIQALAQLFFTELSKRSNNPVYNLLGDIIGSLSQDTIETENMSSQHDASQVIVASLASLHLDKHDAASAIKEKKNTIQKELSLSQYKKVMEFLLQFISKDK